jgi:3-oxoacyl-[acyl-carrier-protein] synthase III
MKVCSSYTPIIKISSHHKGWQFMEYKAKIKGTGIYVPGEAISNEELKKIANIKFDTEMHEKILGIKSRHIAKLRNIDETTADFGEKSCRIAIKDSNINAEDIGLFIVATNTPEYITPATSILIQGRIQKKEKFTGAFDLSSSCASFTTALDVASRMLATDQTINYAAVIGIYNMPAYLRDRDAYGYSIFADGSATFILEKTDIEDKSGYIDGQLMSDGTQWDYIGIYSGGTKKPVTEKMLKENDFGLQLLKALPRDRNEKLWPKLIERGLEKAKTRIEDLDHIIFTQVSKTVIENTMKLMGLPLCKTTMIMDKYGYTGSACVPMAFSEAVKEKKIKRGDLIALISSGAGFAIGMNIFRY